MAGAFCASLGPKLALLATLAAGTFASAIGIGLLCQCLRINRTGTLVAIFVYCANPLTLNELQAGHVPFLLAYAILPWIAAFSLELSRTTWLPTGVLIGLAAAQQQFLAFGLLIAVACGWQSSRALAVRYLPLVTVIALV
ncbi:MAG: hypothetical protein ACREM6_15145, partial [Vulcanimicrobiaceae bacterium]